MASPDTSGNTVRFGGVAGRYDRYRSRPPAALCDLLTELADTPRPGLVVDVGSGTGLSTFLWAERAGQVIGVEPDADMRRAAESHAARARAAHVTFAAGSSTQTNLPDACADIVTCVQSLHWMEPEPTLTEIARILRSGGVFAACDNVWPPAMRWEAEAAFMAVWRRARDLERSMGVSPSVHEWPKDEHLDRFRACGSFQYVRELWLHDVDTGNAERLVGLALSTGSVAAVLRAGVSENEIGLDALRDTARRVLGDEPRPWHFSYHVRLAIKR
jgi:SAM-dependent methyltransferase